MQEPVLQAAASGTSNGRIEGGPFAGTSVGKGQTCPAFRPYSCIGIGGRGANRISYAIYASLADPTNNWAFPGNSTADVGGNFLFTDPNAFQFPRRCYSSIGP